MKYKSNLMLVMCTMLLLTICSINISFTQELKGPYLGQKPPGTIPEIFAPGIISTEKEWEACVSFSPDLKEMFFTRRAEIEGKENRLYYMKQINGKWTRPETPSFAKDVTEYEAIITPDGKRVYFSSARSKPAEVATRGRIWYARKTGAGWTEAQYADENINDGWAMYVSSNLKEELFFTGGYNKIYGVFKSESVNGRYSKPEHLPDEINGFHGASHPFIAPDNSYIIFDAQTAEPAKPDLYISFRNRNGGWTKAVKFPETVNSTKTECIAVVSPDGKYMFFHRNNDVWWVSTKIFEALKPEDLK